MITHARTNCGQMRKGLEPFLVFLCVLLVSVAAAAQNQFEKKPISNITITFAGGAEADTQSVEEYRLIAREAVGDVYSAPKIRDAIEALYNTKRVDSVTVNAKENGAG